ncbi:uncharacterized protein LOC131300597 isoform X2 [Rhododendron vialii]|uniref:uncharacterized protein LOC131300597 isoform X2 n=1 Tax=Rhododendron vialii TaxID=182163 RepID=UPI00265E04AC|nr:uncharacterized protein LOC131300597 isoform X2 [Rhododendron vialii]
MKLTHQKVQSTPLQNRRCQRMCNFRKLLFNQDQENQKGAIASYQRPISRIQMGKGVLSSSSSQTIYVPWTIYLHLYPTQSMMSIFLANQNHRHQGQIFVNPHRYQEYLM